LGRRSKNSSSGAQTYAFAAGSAPWCESMGAITRTSATWPAPADTASSRASCILRQKGHSKSVNTTSVVLPGIARSATAGGSSGATGMACHTKGAELATMAAKDHASSGTLFAFEARSGARRASHTEATEATIAALSTTTQKGQMAPITKSCAARKSAASRPATEVTAAMTWWCIRDAAKSEAVSSPTKPKTPRRGRSRPRLLKKRASSDARTAAHPPSVPQNVPGAAASYSTARMELAAMAITAASRYADTSIAGRTDTLGRV
jgi:hypothetical protein